MHYVTKRAMVGLAVVALAGCVGREVREAREGRALVTGAESVSAVMDKEEQGRMTPEGAMARLKEGNARFVAGKGHAYDYLAQVKETAKGQYPYAVVLSCLDSRAAPEMIFDEGVGSLFVARVAGNYAPVDILGSMEFGTKVAGAKVIVVLGHTECGAVKGACDDVELGNLTAVIEAIKPACAAVKEVAGERNSKNKAYVKEVTEANVRLAVKTIREKSAIVAGLEKEGKVKVVGAMYDIGTGEVRWVE